MSDAAVERLRERLTALGLAGAEAAIRSLTRPRPQERPARAAAARTELPVKTAPASGVTSEIEWC